MTLRKEKPLETIVKLSGIGYMTCQKVQCLQYLGLWGWCHTTSPPQIREDAICSGVVESHGAGCWAREASKMTAAPTTISSCGEQQQSAWQLSADRWDDGFPGPGPVHTAHCLAPSVLSLLWSQEPTSEMWHYSHSDSATFKLDNTAQPRAFP